MVGPGAPAGGGEPSRASSATGTAAPDARADVVGGTAMLTALVRLHATLGDLRLPLAVPGVGAHRDDLDELVSQLEDYLIPRVTTMSGPLLVVVGGSTGAGKSTLVNTLVGRPVTAAGVLRPTTRSPVLIHHPDDAGWFGADRLLPELTRVEGPTTDPGALQVVADAAVPAGVAILDAPDVDSVEAANRALAAELLAAGDLWLFVTSAARYADQVPWDFLRQAAERSTSVAIVLDRTAAEDAPTVATHLARMLASRGLRDCPLLTVPESPVDDAGLLPADAVSAVRGWLEVLAEDSEGRAAVALRTVGGAIRTLGARTHVLAGAAEEQLHAEARLREEASTAYAEAVVRAREATADGTMLRGEVLARWQDFVGSGDLLRSLEERVGRLRERVLNAVRGRPQTAERVGEAIETGLQVMLVEHAEAAAERATAAWRGLEPGERLLETTDADLTRATGGVRRRAERLTREWHDGLVRMVRAEGSERRSTASYLALGADGLTVALMITVLSHAGGVLSLSPRVTDAGPEGQGGAAGVGPRLLQAVFGEQAVLSMASRARGDLDRRVEELLVVERTRYLERLSALGLDPGAPEQLREAARRVDDLRFRSSRPSVSEGATP